MTNALANRLAINEWLLSFNLEGVLKMANVEVYTVPIDDGEVCEEPAATVNADNTVAVEETAAPVVEDGSEVAEAPAGVNSEVASNAYFSVDGDILKATLAPVVACLKQAPRQSAMAICVADGNRLTIRAGADSFAVQVSVDNGKGYIARGNGGFALHLSIAAALCTTADAQALYTFKQAGDNVKISEAGSPKVLNAYIGGCSNLMYTPPSRNYSNIISLYQSDFQQALARVIHAAANPLQNAWFACVNFQVQDKTLTLAATDTAQFATATSPCSANNNCKVNIPVKALQFVKALLNHGDKSATAEIVFDNEGYVKMVVGNWQVTCAHYSQQFNNAASLLEQKTQDKVSFAPADLMAAIDLCSICLTAQNPSIKFRIDNEGTEITAQNLEEGVVKVTKNIPSRLAGNCSKIEFDVDASKLRSLVKVTSQNVAPLFARADKFLDKALDRRNKAKALRENAAELHTQAEIIIMEAASEAKKAEQNSENAKAVKAIITKSNKQALKFTKQAEAAITEANQLEQQAAGLEQQAAGLRQEGVATGSVTLELFDEFIRATNNKVTAILATYAKDNGNKIRKTREPEAAVETTNEPEAAVA